MPLQQNDEAGAVALPARVPARARAGPSAAPLVDHAVRRASPSASLPGLLTIPGCCGIALRYRGARNYRTPVASSSSARLLTGCGAPVKSRTNRGTPRLSARVRASVS